MTLVLVDTAVWIDHFHRSDLELTILLQDGLVVTHPMVIGELALGSIRDRSTVLKLLSGLPSLSQAGDAEVLTLIDRRDLAGTGLGLVDAHLLASVLIAPDARIWTRDRRLDEVARALGVGWELGASS